METFKQKLMLSGSRELKVVEFALGGSVFVASLNQVREILPADVAVVPVPDAVPVIDGALNVRGQIIPLVNLAKFLHLPAVPVTRIIIADIQNRYLGLGVSAVVGVQNITLENIEEATEFPQTGNGSVDAMIRWKEKVVCLLNLEKIARAIMP